MDRNEFVSTLRAVLTGEVPASVVEDNVRYYDAYISQEIAGGKSEKEVLEMLGDPRLIARTIIDTQGQGSGNSGSYEYSYAQEDPEQNKGFHAELNEDGGVDLKYRHFNLNTWYGRLLITIILIVVLSLVFMIVGGILSWILPIILPVLLILWIIRIFFGGRR